MNKEVYIVMTSVEISSIIASFTSVCLAIIAIVLSIFFFKMSTALSESTKEASKSISASVEKLEKLFDKLYADTFSMMRDTVSDMRKHIWPEESAGIDKITEEAEKKADEKVNSLKVEINKELSNMLQTQKITSAKLSSIRNEMRHLIDKAVSSSRRVEIEAREETVRSKISNLISALQNETQGVLAGKIVNRLADKLSSYKIIREIEKMANEGELSLSTPSLRSDTIIKLLR